MGNKMNKDNNRLRHFIICPFFHLRCAIHIPAFEKRNDFPLRICLEELRLEYRLQLLP